jgi:hypothetical protein
VRQERRSGSRHRREKTISTILCRLSCRVRPVAPISRVVGRDGTPAVARGRRAAGRSSRTTLCIAAGRSTARVLHAGSRGRRPVRGHRAIRSQELGPRIRLRALRAQKEIVVEWMWSGGAGGLTPVSEEQVSEVDRQLARTRQPATCPTCGPTCSTRSTTSTPRCARAPYTGALRCPTRREQPSDRVAALLNHHPRVTGLMTNSRFRTQDHRA